MVSPELIRRFPFFSGLTIDQINTLAMNAEELEVEAGHFFMHADDEVHFMYFILEGEVEILMEMAELSRELTLTTVGPTELFGWSALVPPHEAMASAKATGPGKMIAFDGHALLAVFEEDCQFGYRMMTKAAQVLRDRVASMNIEMLAFFMEGSAS